MVSEEGRRERERVVSEEGERVVSEEGEEREREW